MVAHVLQSLAHILVARLDDAGQEAVLVGAPVGVVLERLHLQRHHAYLRVGVVEHALAYLQYLRRQRLYVVVAVGHQVQRVEVFQVAAVGKAVVLQLDLELRVAVLSAVQVGEVHVLHVRVASEGTAAYVVGLVVVRRADVHGDLQCAVVVVQEVLVGIVHQHVLDGVAVLRALLLDGVLLIDVGVPGAVVVQRAAVLGHCLTVLEEPFQRLPRLAGQEVVLARLVDDDVEVQRIHVAEDAVAGQDEVLRAKAVLAVLLSLQNQVELLQVRAALEGVVGDAADERRRVLARGAARVLVEPYFLQIRPVREGILGEGRHAARRVGLAVVVVAHVDGAVAKEVPVKRLHVGVVNDVLLRVRQHVAAAHHGVHVQVGADLLAHTSVEFLGVVRAGAAPCLLGNESGGQRVHAHLLHGGAVPRVGHEAHRLVQAVHQLLLVAAGCLARYADEVIERLGQQHEVLVAHGAQLILGTYELVVLNHA